MESPKKVYLAGPDVFRLYAVEHLEGLKNALKLIGYHGLAPLDNKVDLSDPLASLIIYKENINLIRACDYVVANISPFRSPSIDPGTAYEIGFADALGKKVILYTDSLTEYKSRVIPDEYLIEDFGLIDNLMIVHDESQLGSKSHFGSFAEVLKYLSTLSH